MSTSQCLKRVKTGRFAPCKGAIVQWQACFKSRAQRRQTTERVNWRMVR